MLLFTAAANGAEHQKVSITQTQLTAAQRAAQRAIRGLHADASKAKASHFPPCAFLWRLGSQTRDPSADS